jgi:hypothetical protein
MSGCHNGIFDWKQMEIIDYTESAGQALAV